MYIILEKFFNLINKYHQKRIIEFIKNLNFNCVIDVGAHEGLFIADVNKLEKIKKIYAFEPQTNIFGDLSEKYSNNKNVEIFNLAIDKEITKKDIFINKLSSTSTLSRFDSSSFFLKIKNLITFSRNNYVKKYQVQTNTIDNQFKNITIKNSLLKVDVEGLELDVLIGAEKKIANEIKYVLVEHKYGKQYKNSKKDEVHDFLSNKNFVVEKVFYYPTFHFKDVLYKRVNY